MRPAAFYAVLSGLAVALFLFAPGVDLAFSRLFYDGVGGFPLADWAPLRLFEGAVPWIVRLLIVLAVLAAAWLGLVGRPLWRLDRKALVFLVAATALGPGLIANTLLKDHWGRARPYQVEAFGGTRQFTPAPLPAGECGRNCAFVSGHAALGFSLISFALLLPPGRRRTAATAAVLAFGALIGLGRIAAGRHFLSDVVFAGLISVATSWLLYQWLVLRDALGSPAARRAYRALGDALRSGWALARRTCAHRIGRAGLWAAGIALIEMIAIGWIDRPVAEYFHGPGAEWKPLFGLISPLGLALPYLVAFGVAFVALRWGGLLPRLRPWAGRLHAMARVPGLLFAAIAVSGIVVDLLKVIVGRPRPKLLFAAGDYDFSWIGLGADHWSFPSGHAATIAALMTALWCLWPQHLLFYIAVSALVAASRVVIGAHYFGDVVMGGFIAVLATRGVAAGLARGWPVFRLRRSSAAQAAAPPTPAK